MKKVLLGLSTLLVTTLFIQNTYAIDNNGEDTFLNYWKELDKQPAVVAKFGIKLLDIREKKYIAKYGIDEGVSKYQTFLSKLSSKIKYIQSMPKYAKYNDLLNRLLTVITNANVQTGYCWQKVTGRVEHPYINPVEKYCPFLSEDIKKYNYVKTGNSNLGNDNITNSKEANSIITPNKTKYTQEELFHIFKKDFENGNTFDGKITFSKEIIDLQNFAKDVDNTPDNQLETKFKEYLEVNVENGKLQKMIEENSRKFEKYNNNNNPELTLPDRKIMEDIINDKIEIGTFDKNKVISIINKEKNKQISNLENNINKYYLDYLKDELGNRLYKIENREGNLILGNKLLIVRKPNTKTKYITYKKGDYGKMLSHHIAVKFSQKKANNPNLVYFYYIDEGGNYNIIELDKKNFNIFPYIEISSGKLTFKQKVALTSNNPNNIRNEIISRYLIRKLNINKNGEIEKKDSLFLIGDNLYYSYSLTRWSILDITKIYDGFIQLNYYILNNIKKENNFIYEDYVYKLDLDYVINLGPLELYKNIDINSFKNISLLFVINNLKVLKDFSKTKTKNFDNLIKKDINYIKEDIKKQYKYILSYLVEKNPKTLKDIYNYITNIASYDYKAYNIYNNISVHGILEKKQYDYFKASTFQYVFEEGKGICSGLSNALNVISTFAGLPVGEYSGYNHQISIINHRAYDITADIDRYTGKGFDAMPIMLSGAKETPKSKLVMPNVNYPDEYKKYLKLDYPFFQYLKSNGVKVEVK